MTSLHFALEISPLLHETIKSYYIGFEIYQKKSLRLNGFSDRSSEENFPQDSSFF